MSDQHVEGGCDPRSLDHLAFEARPLNNNQMAMTELGSASGPVMTLPR